ncbi:unnamed protein product [Medioppia subpectinata]|uniref:SH3 domain-containing protein n=1 Tax=Medioppia subpectinata TaxID=1979941 RepID=A0A7R9KE30_9ACAR|nr:unnamed protein product [Medioppia subpectinata]CAG2101673.1 unnamed protein product [Medioppia subpectinata]
MVRESMNSNNHNSTFENMGRNEGTEGEVSVGEEGNTPQERHKREERNQSHVSIGVTLGQKSRDIESDRTDQLSTRVMSSSAAGGDKPTVSKRNASKLREKFESMAQNEEMVVKRRADEERDRRLEREKHEMKAVKEGQQVVTKAAVNPESDAEKQNPDFGKTAKPSNNSASPTGLTATALYDYKAADFDEISFDINELITDIEMIDEGWCRGRCGGEVGLFPTSYVRFNQMPKSEITDKANDIEIASIGGNSLAIDPKYNCGFFHSLVVTGDDCVYGWGYNNEGQTGCGLQHSTELIIKYVAFIVILIPRLPSQLMAKSSDGVEITAIWDTI